MKYEILDAVVTACYQYKPSYGIAVNTLVVRLSGYGYITFIEFYNLHYYRGRLSGHSRYPIEERLRGLGFKRKDLNLALKQINSFVKIDLAKARASIRKQKRRDK